MGKEFETKLPKLDNDPFFPEDNENKVILKPKGNKDNEEKRTGVQDGITVPPLQDDIVNPELLSRSNTDTSNDIATSLKMGIHIKTNKRVRVRYPFEYYEDELKEFMNLKDLIRKYTQQEVSYSRMAREAMNDYKQKIKLILKDMGYAN